MSERNVEIRYEEMEEKLGRLHEQLAEGDELLAAFVVVRDRLLKEVDALKADNASLKKEIQRWYDKLEASDEERDEARELMRQFREYLLDVRLLTGNDLRQHPWLEETP